MAARKLRSLLLVAASLFALACASLRLEGAISPALDGEYTLAREYFEGWKKVKEPIVGPLAAALSPSLNGSIVLITEKRLVDMLPLMHKAEEAHAAAILLSSDSVASSMPQLLFCQTSLLLGNFRNSFMAFCFF